MCLGNSTTPTDDRHIVEHDDRPDDVPIACGAARELISADADREAGPDARRRLRVHLAACASCSAYAGEVAALARSTRLRVARVDESFVTAVMQRAQPARLGRGGWMRPALVWCGLLIGAQSVAPLLFGSADGAPAHVARHVGASTLALSVGLLYVAWKPHRAVGLLPYVAALFAAMLLGAVVDLVGGERSAASEVVHLAELVGMVLVWLIAGSPGLDRALPGGGGPQRAAGWELASRSTPN